MPSAIQAHGFRAGDNPAMERDLAAPRILDGDALLKRLPPVRGRLTANAPLGATSWFGVGGAAEILFRPADVEDLAGFLKACPSDIPVLPIGVASNLIIRDGGVPGIVVRLGGTAFTDVTVDGLCIAAGAAALDLTVAQQAAAHGVAGLEFLSGIPGQIGGGLRMNCGAYGAEIKDILIDATVVTRAGDVRTLSPADIGHAYRHCDLPEDWIFTRCRLQGRVGDPVAIAARMADIKTARAATQPIHSKTGGSTFANPDPALSGGRKAWQLIDQAGCRGLRIGDAEISELHCNFMINRGKATARDIEALGEAVISRVAAAHNIALRWEIRRVGIARTDDNELPCPE